MGQIFSGGANPLACPATGKANSLLTLVKLPTVLNNSFGLHNPVSQADEISRLNA